MAGNDPQQKQRMELPPEAEPARAFIEALLERYEERVAELEAKVEERTKKLTPRNFSVPPSTEHPHARPKKSPEGRSKKRKRGGQKGHGRNTRALMPSEEWIYRKL